MTDDFPDRLGLLIDKGNVHAFAKKIGMSDPIVRQYLSGKSQPSRPAIIQIIKATGVSADWLLTGEGPMKREVVNSAEQEELSKRGIPEGYYVPGKKPEELTGEYVRIPRYEVAASAGGGSFVDSEVIADYLTFQADWIKNTLRISLADLALINVIGDSMEPSLSEGDVVLLDLSQSGVRDSSIYVIQLDGALLVKRIQRKLDGSLTVSSDNPRYTPETVAGEAMAQLKIIGRVVWVGRRL